MEGYLSLKQAAAYLGGKSESFVSSLVAKGELVASDVGNGLVNRSLLFSKDDLDAFVASRRLSISKPLPKSKAKNGVRLGVLKLGDAS
jgi:hypothetical protein